VSIDGLLLLPGDVRIVPVLDLDPAVRARIEARDGDYTISRPRSRVPGSILDADGVELLENFRRPVRVVDAIVAFAGRRGRDPRATLEGAYPMLSRLYRMQVLVPAAGEPAGPIESELAVGDSLAGFRLLRRVQAMNDNEVFLARDAHGRYAAVKFVRRPGARAARELAREACLLRRAAGRAPAVFGLSRFGAGVGLAMEWICGVDARQAAALLRGGECGRDERGLMSLCIETVTAFAYLHERGVLHGDVHPSNVLVEASGSVRLIDFGLARDMRRLRADGVRGGVPFYYEPELAQAMREGRTVALSAPGEQYAVAVLLYELWTGVHYLDWSLEREQTLRQIVEDHPIAFEARRVPPWPGLEQVLRRALDKSPQGRFAGLRALADALAALLPEARERDRRRSPGRAAATAPIIDLLELALQRYALGGQALREGLAGSPLASISYGAAGIAYALLRIAQRRGDPQLLAAADLWSHKAFALAARDDAFYSAQLQIERATVGEVSLFHSVSGLHCVRALVSAAQGDAASANAAMGAFVEHAARPCGCDLPSAQIDLVSGRAGLLLGCAELIESVPDLPAFDLAGLRVRGAQIAGELLARVRCESIEVSSLTALGIAHGWGGLLFSLLRWSRAIRCSPDPVISERLRELAAQAQPDGCGLRWPVDTMDSSFVDSWCNGSAGHAMLFALACQVLGDADLGRLAGQAAVSAWSGGSQLGSLCCGQGGIGYALLAMHRLTGEDLWLQRARAAARRAAADRSKHFPDSALYKGALGVALLLEDLKTPQTGAMPLFEPVATDSESNCSLLPARGSPGTG
jgi:eukaryotic-like serine/threonine-protein kinase